MVNYTITWIRVNGHYESYYGGIWGHLRVPAKGYSNTQVSIIYENNSWESIGIYKHKNLFPKRIVYHYVKIIYGDLLSWINKKKLLN